MTEGDSRLKAYVENWKILGPILERKRHEALRRIDTKIVPLVKLKDNPETLEQLNDLRRSLREL